MELNEFIKETLLQITQGVKEAQEAVQDHNGIVNPAEVNGSTMLSTHVEDKKRLVQVVDFEVGLTATDETNSKKGIGVALGAIKGDAGNNKGSKNTTATKIKFSIPIVLPSMTNDNTPPTYSIGNNRRNSSNRY